MLPHWNRDVQARYAHLEKYQHTPPTLLHAPFYPQLGCYSSRDTATIATHFKDMLAHGITVAVISWTGREGKTSDTQGVVTDAVLPVVLATAELHGMKIAIHLEPYPSRSPTTIRDDLQYLTDRYGSSPAIYRRKRPHCGEMATSAPDCDRSLPVYYVYDSYHNPVEEWSEVLCEKASTLNLP